MQNVPTNRVLRAQGRSYGRVLLGTGLAALCAVVFIASASASPERAQHGFVNVSVGGTGNGHVTSSPGGIDCPGVCNASFPSPTDVSLAASPDSGSEFEGWGGACSGSGDCSFTVRELVSYNVGAGFTAVRPPTLPLTTSVTGKGRVTSTPAGIDCGQVCAAPFATDSEVLLTAAAFPGWSFAGWGGSCSGNGSCTVRMDGPHEITATFAPPDTSYALAVAADGGVVTSDIEGIDCGGLCSTSYGIGVGVTLTANGSPVAWAGACAGTGATCGLTMDGPKAVSVRIGGAPSTRAALAVAVTGKGAIASDGGTIACGSVCGGVFALGSRVALTVAPADGWLFAGWQLGACRGVARTCTLTVTAPTTVSAVFVEAGTVFPLALTKAGRGRVISTPAGLDCGSACSGSFQPGSTVTLKGEAAKGWAFVRWSGACTGKRPACTVPMDGPKSVSAVFGKIADQKAPVVKAIPSAGGPGQIAQLRYRVSDASGKSREWASVFTGRKRLAIVRGRLDAIDRDALYYFLPWRVPRALAPQKLRFCVSAVDPIGNRSRPSCAPLQIR